MHFSTIASIALLACASSAQEIVQPYRLARAAVPFQSLARRSTPGYQPELSNCHEGATCAEACGQGYETCPSNDQQTHCFNPAKKQSCCTDGTGNSCDEGFYCTHDTKLQTWCCPNAMSLEQCAAAYNVGGSLAAATAQPTTSVAPTTSTSTSAKPTPTTTKASSTPVATTTKVKTTTTTSCPTPSATHVSVWTPSANGTVTGTGKTQATVPIAVVPTTAPAPGGGSSSGAATTGISALLLVAAGAIALL